MLRILDRLSTARLRWLLEPAVGALFVALWCFAEVGRWNSHLPFYAAPVIYGVAIGISRRFPRVALGMGLLVPVLQLSGMLPMASANDWPVHLAMPLIVFLVTVRSRGALTWGSLAAGVAHAAGLAFMLVYLGQWLLWTGSYGAGVERYSASGELFFQDGAQDMARNLGLGEIDLTMQESMVQLMTGPDGQIAGVTVAPPMPELLLSSAAQLALVFVALTVLAWALGTSTQFAIKWARERAMRTALTEELSASSTEVLVLHERSRIAREVHDVLAHSLTVTISMADGSRLLRESRGEPADDLQKIADNARSTLLELQGLLEDIGGAGSAPQPKLDELGALIDQACDAGLEVELRHLGERKRLSQVQELSVFRIVQESLTNAMKHAGSEASATVSLDWRGAGLSLNIVSTGASSSGSAEDPPQRSGLGLTGMRERARLAGGWLTAGAEPSDGEAKERQVFVVTAFIPTQDIVPRVAATEDTHLAASRKEDAQ
ncbi:sensor histidine kinase [Pseudoclavibacter sp. Z016]|uniref:sensor histidine kinase n=1 Tax=Pseudoclavibacter sp. Z016 TaxID=2080581 RepID=UPI000CE88333|nr:histidine kinase [Pseudoclavibacter sp. Z016]